MPFTTAATPRLLDDDLADLAEHEDDDDPLDDDDDVSDYDDGERSR